MSDTFECRLADMKAAFTHVINLIGDEEEFTKQQVIAILGMLWTQLLQRSSGEVPETVPDGDTK